jgi:uncharacterized protein
MKIAIVADIHDNIVNLEKLINWCNATKVGAIICAGDITNAETLEFLATKFAGTIYLIRGNMEIYEEAEIKKYKNINYYGRFGVANIEGKNIGLCHEPPFVNELLKGDKCDLIFYGHTHKPWIEEKQGVKIINPGTLSGTFQRASFAVWEVENGKIDLNLLELI